MTSSATTPATPTTPETEEVLADPRATYQHQAGAMTYHLVCFGFILGASMVITGGKLDEMSPLTLGFILVLAGFVAALAVTASVFFAMALVAPKASPAPAAAPAAAPSPKGKKAIKGPSP